MGSLIVRLYWFFVWLWHELRIAGIVILLVMLARPARAQDLTASTRRCVLISRTLCDAIHDKPVLALAVIHTGMIIGDGYLTEKHAREGYPETDPIARALIGRYPTWGRMAPIGAAWILGETYLAERMHRSHNRIARRLWWLPQSMGIAANGVGLTVDFQTRISTN